MGNITLVSNGPITRAIDASRQVLRWLLACMWFCGVSAYGVSDPAVDLRQHLAKISERDYFDPVLESLRQRIPQADPLHSLLDEVGLKVSAEPLSRPVTATYDGTRPVITIDLSFVQRMYSHADLGAILLFGQEGPVKRYTQMAGFKFAQAVKRASKGGPEPKMDFNARLDIDDPDMRMIAQYLSWEVFFRAAAWTVLHELGHHALEHLDAEILSDGQLRQWEEQADDFAFEAMDRLGYGLGPLYAMLKSMEGEETLLELTGLRARHPAYPPVSQRAQKLSTSYDLNKAKLGGWQIFTHFADGNGDGLREPMTFYVPNSDGADGRFLAIYLEGDRDTVFLTFVRNETGVHLYGREGDDLSEIVIHEPNRLHPKMSVGGRSLASGETWGYETRGIQTDWAAWQSAKVSDIRILDIVSTTPMELFADAVQKLNTSDEVAGRVMSTQRKMLGLVREKILDYSRGQQARNTTDEQVGAIQAEAKRQMRIALGASLFTKLFQQLAQDPFIALGMETLNREQVLQPMEVRP